MTWLDVVAGLCLVVGGLLSFFAGLAVLRFPDLLTRTHAATKPQTLGVIFLMVGVGLRLQSLAVLGLLALVVVLQSATAPVAAHLVVRAAHRRDGGGPLPDSHGDTGDTPEHRR